MVRLLTGRVVSDGSDKTIVVAVLSRRTHPIYKKQYRVTSRFMAHDADNEAKRGDLVAIAETRPISARKRFRLAKVLERAGVAFAETDATADLPPEPAPAAKPEPKPKAKPAPKKAAAPAVKETKK